MATRPWKALAPPTGPEFFSPLFEHVDDPTNVIIFSTGEKLQLQERQGLSFFSIINHVTLRHWIPSCGVEGFTTSIKTNVKWQAGGRAATELSDEAAKRATSVSRGHGVPTANAG